MSFLMKKDTSKTEYQNLKISEKTNYKIQMIWSIITIYLMLIGIWMWIGNYSLNDNHVVLIKQNQPLVYTVSDKFLSFGLDSSLLRNMQNLPINDERFVNLAHHLSPAYIRIGGTAADCLYFNQNTTASRTKTKTIEEKYLRKSPVDGQDISNFTLSSNDFLSLYKFSQNSQIRMIFDLNTLLRNPDGTWDSDNAKEIILFAKGHKMELDWQMGNEPNSFYHVFSIHISAEQLAKDYCELRTILNELGYQESILVGPEANHIGDEDHRGAVYAKQFLDNVKDCIDYITWHQYYLDGHTAQVQDFVNSKIFNRLPVEINTMAESIKSSGQKLSMWISETSSAYGGGAPELSNRFVAGFLWLDKLGYSAKAGVQTLIRQSLFGGNYAMVGPDLEPNPDWWVAVLYKQFVSEKVLDLVTPNNFGNVRLYAHCSAQQEYISKASAVTIYGINLNEEQTKIYITGPTKGSKIFSYILTSDNLQSRNILMNGKILKLQGNGHLPPFEPKIIEVNQPIILPPYSMAFFLINNMKIPACSEL